MIPLPTACPTCKTAGILYSVGVIRSAFPSVWREYPVVWCAHCRRAYFTCLPSILWCRCTVHPHGLAFTTDPETIDHRLKLAYDYTIPTVSPLIILLLYCHINGFQRASSAEKPLPGGKKRMDGGAAHPVAW
jgi:hypothetical protein